MVKAALSIPNKSPDATTIISPPPDLTIVTGRGKRSIGGRPLLKGAVEDMLRNEFGFLSVEVIIYAVMRKPLLTSY